MSTNLYWLPVIENKAHNLPGALKYAISQRFFGHDGSLTSEKIVLGRNDRAYIEGLCDAGVEGAQALLTAIEKHGTIEIWTAE